MTNQPANSPDFNVLNLGLLRRLRAMQDKYAPRTTQELIEAYKAAFDAYDPRYIDSNFISLQKCLKCSLLNYGVNRYKKQHVGKVKNRNEGNPITNIVCDRSIYNLGKNVINESR